MLLLIKLLLHEINVVKNVKTIMYDMGKHSKFQTFLSNNFNTLRKI